MVNMLVCGGAYVYVCVCVCVCVCVRARALRKVSQDEMVCYINTLIIIDHDYYLPPLPILTPHTPYPFCSSGCSLLVSTVTPS